MLCYFKQLPSFKVSDGYFKILRGPWCKGDVTHLQHGDMVENSYTN